MCSTGEKGIMGRSRKPCQSWRPPAPSTLLGTPPPFNPHSSLGCTLRGHLADPRVNPRVTSYEISGCPPCPCPTSASYSSQPDSCHLTRMTWSPLRHVSSTALQAGLWRHIKRQVPSLRDATCGKRTGALGRDLTRRAGASSRPLQIRK